MTETQAEQTLRGDRAPWDGPVVVGVDGSLDSERAVDWAFARAAELAVPLHVVHGSVYVEEELGAEHRRAAEEHADRVLEMARAKAAAHPEVTVTYEQSQLGAADALVDASTTAGVVVIGAHGHGVLTGALLGSVSQHVTRHAHSPVAVVREQSDTGATRIVVGLDRSDGAKLALAAALRLAGAQGAQVTVMRAWDRGDALEIEGSGTVLREGTDDEWWSAVVRQLDEDLEPLLRNYPNVKVEQDVSHGHAQRMLIDASRHAALVVVGSRGRGGLRGLLLGSVSQSLVQHAACPVLVVR